MVVSNNYPITPNTMWKLYCLLIVESVTGWIEMRKRNMFIILCKNVAYHIWVFFSIFIINNLMDKEDLVDEMVNKTLKQP